MSVSQGKIHEYLLMILYYTVRGQVSITMLSYIEEIITAFDKGISEREGHKVKFRTKQYFCSK